MISLFLDVLSLLVLIISFKPIFFVPGLFDQTVTQGLVAPLARIRPRRQPRAKGGQEDQHTGCEQGGHDA